ncbi:hypothetical protein BH11ACT8_BH11ACT8_29930 [soil metagenome]
MSADIPAGAGCSSQKFPIGVQVGNALTGHVRKLPTSGGGAVCRTRGLDPDSTTGDGRFLVWT